MEVRGGARDGGIVHDNQVTIADKVPNTRRGTWFACYRKHDTGSKTFMRFVGYFPSSSSFGMSATERANAQ